MTNTFFSIDIETVPNDAVLRNGQDYLPSIDKRLKDPKKIEAAEEELEERTVKFRSCDPAFGRIACIGVIKCHEDLVTGEIGITDRNAIIHKDEKVILESFWNLIRGTQFRTLTYNGLNFDLPYIFLRSMINGVKTPERAELRKYSYFPHFDLMEALRNWDRQTFRTMDFWLEVFGLPTKSGSGSEVFGWWKEGNFGQIAQYCLDDCEANINLYRRIRDYYIDIESMHPRDYRENIDSGVKYDG